MKRTLIVLCSVYTNKQSDLCERDPSQFHEIHLHEIQSDRDRKARNIYNIIKYYHKIYMKHLDLYTMLIYVNLNIK